MHKSPKILDSLSILSRLTLGVVIARRPKPDAAIFLASGANRSNAGDCRGPRGPRNDACSFNLDGATYQALNCSVLASGSEKGVLNVPGQVRMITAEQIIEMFGMKPLVGEGGYYVETYRSEESHQPPSYPGKRNFGSAILYLLTPDTFSRLHRLRSDEVWHFYLGDSATMLQLHPDGSHEVITLGHDIAASQQVQIEVAEGTWQGSFLNEGGKFALMGTTVAPAFDFADFQPADRKTLLKKYPARKDLILRLTADQ